MIDHANRSIDAAAALAILASILQYLPPFAALLGIIWYCLQIWESVTVTTLRRQHEERKRLRLDARRALLQAKSALASTVAAPLPVGPAVVTMLIEPSEGSPE